MAGPHDIGTIYQMPTACGFLYLQKVGSDATFGTAVAVFGDIELSDFRFSILFPLGSAVRQKIVTRAGKSEVPSRYTPLRFRYPLGPLGNERWMIVEHGGQRKVESLSPEQIAFVLAFAVNDTALEGLFCDGWIEGNPFPTLGDENRSNGS